MAYNVNYRVGTMVQIIVGALVSSLISWVQSLTLPCQKEKPTSLGCPLISTCVLWHVCAFYTYTHTHIHTYTHTHIHTYTHTHIHTYTHTHIHTCTHIHTHTHIHTYTHTHIHTYTHTCTHIHIHTYTHTHTEWERKRERERNVIWNLTIWNVIIALIHVWECGCEESGSPASVFIFGMESLYLGRLVPGLRALLRLCLHSCQLHAQIPIGAWRGGLVMEPGAYFICCFQFHTLTKLKIAP
jgi:hypothetical protein